MCIDRMLCEPCASISHKSNGICVRMGFVFYLEQVIIAYHGVVLLSSKIRSEQRMGTLLLTQYAQTEETYIEWKSFNGDGIWRTNVDDLKRILIKKRRCLILINKFDEWNFEYYFPKGNARAFVRMLEVTHCVRYKWNPNPFVMHFVIVEKQKSIRTFSDLKIEDILGRKRSGRKKVALKLKRNIGCAKHSVPESTSVECKVKHRNAGFIGRIFRGVKFVCTKLINVSFFWPIVKMMAKATFATVSILVDRKIIRFPFIQRIRSIGINAKVCGVLLNVQLTFLSSLFTGAYRLLKYVYNYGCNEFPPIDVRYLIQ